MHDEVFKTLHTFTFQGKFIRINFDASGYIAGANIGKKKDFLYTKITI